MSAARALKRIGDLAKRGAIDRLRSGETLSGAPIARKRDPDGNRPGDSGGGGLLPLLRRPAPRVEPEQVVLRYHEIVRRYQEGDASRRQDPRPVAGLGEDQTEEAARLLGTGIAVEAGEMGLTEGGS